MQQHFQTDSESIYAHGLAVWNYTEKLISGNISDMRVPQWYHDYKERILKTLPNKDAIKNYCTFHDLGKVFCLEIDENGKRHFPNHEIISEQKWMELSEDIPDKALIAKLIRYDMLFHKETVEDILALKLPPQIICTLILSALAAIHANADSFGGRDSDSYKIKLKNLDKRAKKILPRIFDHEYVYVIVRNDLSPAQRAVQSCHAIIETTRNFNMSGEHPSVIICEVKSEHKLREIATELSGKNIKYSAFHEPDIGGQLTAIASEPLRLEKRDAFKRFQLLR